jgi:hypothetical protein
MIEGKSNAQLSRETGVSSRRVRQIKAEPETKALLVGLAEEFESDLEEILLSVVAYVKEALKAPA